MNQIENFVVTIKNSKNQEVILEGANPVNFGLIAIDGIDATQYTQSINTNGATFGGTLTGTKLSPRQLSFEFALMKNQNEQANRLFLERFLSPLQEFDVVISRLDTSRHIKARVSAFNVSQEFLQASQYCKLTMVAPNPFLMDMSDFGKDIASVDPQFAPPFLMNATTGQIMGIIKNDNLTTIINNGDLDVGFSARFVAKDNVSDIVLYDARNSTLDPLSGSFIRVIETMQSGDIINISMMDGAKSITKTTTVGEQVSILNIINRLDRASSFFKIKQGANVIGYQAETGQNALEVRLYYTPLYFGV
jgi:hypothetical protein